jgi:O-acetylserine/cysteine efflux transporter
MTAHTRFGVRDAAVALAINLVWGLNIVAIKMSVDSVPPFTAALLRQAMVLFACLPWLVVVPGRMRALLALSVIVGAAFFAVVNLSVSVTENVGALAIASLLGAPFALLLAVVVLGERIGAARIAGVALAIAGCVLLVFDPAAGREWLGLAINAVGSFLWAIGSLLQRRLSGVGVGTMYAWIGLGGVVLLGPAALILELTRLPPEVFGWLAFSALGSTLIGSGGMAWLLARHPVSTVVPVTLASPVIGVAASALVFGNPVTPIMIAGGIIALAGVAIVTTRTARAGKEQA